MEEYEIHAVFQIGILEQEVCCFDVGFVLYGYILHE